MPGRNSRCQEAGLLPGGDPSVLVASIKFWSRENTSPRATRSKKERNCRDIPTLADGEMVPGNPWEQTADPKDKAGIRWEAEAEFGGRAPQENIQAGNEPTPWRELPKWRKSTAFRECFSWKGTRTLTKNVSSGRIWTQNSGIWHFIPSLSVKWG